MPNFVFSGIFFSFPGRPRGKLQLLPGSNSKNRFSHLLAKMVQSLNENELQRLGCGKEEIDTHSLRKGSSTYALGQVSGPTPVSVFLRMGQSLGQLKDRYIHSAEGADQLCGRMVCGLPFHSRKFGCLPPHFSNGIRNKMNTNFWKDILTDYEIYPKGMKSALPYLLASVVHHELFFENEFK
jgi:hypothetical protein